MRILSAAANLLANAKSKLKFLPANLSSTIFHRFLSTTAAPALALSPNLKQHENTNKNLMLMVRVLHENTYDHYVISTENNSFRVVQDTLPKLRSQKFRTEGSNADHYVRASSNHKWMLLTCRKVLGHSYELLWDPKTDETKPLPFSANRPTIPMSPLCWGFGVGFDPRASGDYKVVRSQSFSPRVHSEVLSLRTGSWKEITYPYNPMFRPFDKLALHINGFYYWLASHIFDRKFYAIIPFDFANEEFLPDLIDMPVSQKLGYNARYVPAEFHGSLAVVVYNFNQPPYTKKMQNACFEIWVWGNDYWSCVEEFEVPAYCGALHAIIGLYKNDKLLIQDSDGDLLLYDCETRNLKNLGIHDDSFNLQVYPYGNTFLSTHQ